MKPICQEIVIGITAPVGTDINLTSNQIKTCINGYKIPDKTIHIKFIKITEMLNNISSRLGLDLHRKPMQLNNYQELYLKMQLGSHIRKELKNNAVLAMGAVKKIREKREETLSSNSNENEIISIYIINQLKRYEEISLLHSVYGASFIHLALQDFPDSTKRNLEKRFSRDSHKNEMPIISSTFQDDIFKDIQKNDPPKTLAEFIIEKDLKETDDAFSEYGQNLEECHQKAHYFINCGLDKPSHKNQVERFCKMIFGDQFMQPTRAETFMFHAFGEAKRSLDISRQTGAVIVNSDNEILSVGHNDVHALGKSLSQESPEHEGLFDYSLAKNFNKEILQGIEDNIISKNKDLDPEKLSQLRKSVKSSLKPLIGYHRTLCAEMAAIIASARKGVSIRNAIMYCTTFPCHICMKHIIASGLKKVIYIEPYPKSKSYDMLDRFININSSCECKDKINILPYIGVSPKRYLHAFPSHKRSSLISEDINVFSPEMASYRKNKYTICYSNQEESVESYFDILVSGHETNRNKDTHFWAEKISKKHTPDS